MTRAEGSQAPARVPLVRASGTRVDVYPRPPEGWTEPDSRGHVQFTVHGPSTYIRAPKREGYEVYFVGVHGQNYTRWTYRPIKEQR